MVEAFHKVGVVAKLWVLIRTLEVEEKLVE